MKHLDERTAAGVDRAARLHPGAIALLPVPAVVAMLTTGSVVLVAALAGISLILAYGKGIRAGAAATLAAMVMTLVLWTGFSLSLPHESAGGSAGALPFGLSTETALIALRGALRIVAATALVLVTASYVRWSTLSDSLIRYCGLSYRIADAVGLASRFAVLVRRDFDSAVSLVRLRARGRWFPQLRLAAGLAIPILMGAFRHADELSQAMELRGFGLAPRRTVHQAAPVRFRDLGAVLLVWTGTLIAAWHLV